MIPFLGTALGSAFVFFMKKEMPALVQKVLLGFASGVMVAASVWSLLIPSMEKGQGTGAVIPPTVGLLAGFAFLLLIDYITPHIHASGEAEGPRSSLSRTAKLALAVTIHNFPEGMAVGVAIAGALSSANFNMAGALALSLGIAIQNVPEGAIISMPLRAAGNSRWKAFAIGALSGIVEPIGGALVLFLATSILGIMPYMLAFGNHRVCPGLCPDDGAGCGAGLKSTENPIIISNSPILFRGIFRYLHTYFWIIC